MVEFIVADVETNMHKSVFKLTNRYYDLPQYVVYRVNSKFAFGKVYV